MSRHTFFCVDAHTCGNPVRVVTAGAPWLPNLSMAEKRVVFARDHDWVRRALMFEPRGHDVMSGVILYAATRDDCDIGFLFIEVSGYLPMCGHGTIGTVTAILEEGLVVPRQEGKLAIEVPAGRIEIEYVRDEQFVEKVRLYNVASYLHAADAQLQVPGIGALKVDLSYGGNYYVIESARAEGSPREAGASASGRRAHPGRQPRHVVRQGAQSACACAQCRVLRGEGD